MIRKKIVALLHFIVLAIIPCLLFPSFVHCKCKRQPIIFSFGDSSDTGGLAAGLGYILSYPHGRTFFHKPSGRYCDGRIMLDFLCESLNTSYLSPYMESLHANFRNGANFAVDVGDLLHPRAPFSLTIQVLQFLRFQKRSLELIANGAKNFVGDEGFKNALYLIEVGQNDMKLALTSLSYGDVVAKIPSMISEIELALWKIHDHGGRNFWVHNIGPLGCLPQMLVSSKATDFDRHGCLQSINEGVEQFNYKLHARLEQLRLEMNNVTIVYVDVYAIKYDLIAKYPVHGFENPLMACCGYGGPPYNYNQNMKCGETGYNVCKEGSRYVNWDGLHYTEAANAIIASKILSTDYSQPPLKFDFFCNTDLS